MTTHTGELEGIPPPHFFDFGTRDLRGPPKPDYASDSDGVGVGVSNK